MAIEKHETVRSGIHGDPNLQEQKEVTPDGEYQKTKPMSERSFRQRGDGISLRLTRKLVTVPRDNQEVLDVDADRLAVAPPEWSDRVQQEGQHVHADVPELLVSIPIFLVESGYQWQLGSFVSIPYT